MTVVHNRVSSKLPAVKACDLVVLTDKQTDGRRRIHNLFGDYR